MSIRVNTLVIEEEKNCLYYSKRILSKILKNLFELTRTLMANNNSNVNLQLFTFTEFLAVRLFNLFLSEK